MKRAAIRGLRTFLQTTAGMLAAVPVASAVSDITVQGGAILLALYSGLFAGAVSFLQNAAEGLAGVDGAAS